METKARGTAGAVKLAARLIKTDTFLVLNEDPFLAIDLRGLLDAHLRSNANATIALARMKNAVRYDSVILTAEGQVEAFSEKQTPRYWNFCGATHQRGHLRIQAIHPRFCRSTGPFPSNEKFSRIWCGWGNGRSAVPGTRRWLRSERDYRHLCLGQPSHQKRR